MRVVLKHDGVAFLERTDDIIIDLVGSLGATGIAGRNVPVKVGVAFLNGGADEARHDAAVVRAADGIGTAAREAEQRGSVAGDAFDAVFDEVKVSIKGAFALINLRISMRGSVEADTVAFLVGTADGFVGAMTDDEESGFDVVLFEDIQKTESMLAWAVVEG